MYLLSIVIPNYNNAIFLPRCLNSILKSKRKELEVIIVDDGSEDDSVSYLSSIDDTRVHCIFKENQGVSTARNIGIEHTTGQFITFCDSDDYYITGAIDRILDYLETCQQKGQVIIFDACVEQIQSDRTRIRREWKNEFTKLQYKKGTHQIDCRTYVEFLCRNSTMSSVFNKIYDNNLLKTEGIFFKNEISMGEDSIFNLAYAICCKEVLYIPEIIYIYCQDESLFNSGIMKRKFSTLQEIASGLKIKENYVKKYSQMEYLDENSKKILHKCLNEYGIEQFFHWGKKVKKEIGKAEFEKYLNDNSEIKILLHSYLMKDYEKSLKRIIQAFVLFIWSF